MTLLDDIIYTTFTVQGNYSLETMMIILHKYLIQIRNTVEEDVNTPDEAMLYLISKHLVRLYRPDIRPMDSPIAAVKELLEDYEYEVTMIAL